MISQMWLGKFLDLEEDIGPVIKKELFREIKKKKLTPLEFTIIESIFQAHEISGYDLIQKLDAHFAGTWKANSGTVYPILSKLKHGGFLNIRSIKSPIGPLKKVYSLTEAGEEILKRKVNVNFSNQIKFVENFLTELASIFIESFDDKFKKEETKNVLDTLQEMFDRVLQKVSTGRVLKCPSCDVAIDNIQATFCPHCGAQLREPDANDK